jgi:hypothetical protein
MGPETTGDVWSMSAALNISPRDRFIIKTGFRYTREEKEPQLDNNAVFVQFSVDF